MQIDITKRRQEYRDRQLDWELTRDTLRGENHIKSKGVKYLPKTSGHVRAEAKDPVNGTKPYENFKARAEFYDATQHAYRAMVALAHDAKPEISLPSGMNYLLESATIDNLPLDELAKRVTREQLITGRCITLADAPVDGGDPYLLTYRAESLINWMGGRRYVLELTRDIAKDNGAIENQKYYREFLLLRGVYVSRLWEPDGNGKYNITATTPIEGLNGIPLVIAGSVDITDDVDEVPMLPMAKCCIASYQMSADYRHTLYMCGQPTPYATGCDKTERPTEIGSSVFISIPSPDAKLGYLEVSGASLAEQANAIDRKKAEADMYGVRLANAGAGEAAEAMKVRLISQQATLKSIVQAGGQAIEAQLKNIAVWRGLNPDDVIYRPHLEFSDVSLDNQTITSLVSGINTGLLPPEMLWEYCRKSGLTEYTDQQIAALISDRSSIDDLE